MTVLNRLEKHFGWMAIGQLPIYIVTAQAIVYVWGMLHPEQMHLLVLDPVAVQLGHEYWRLLTFLFITPLQNPLFAFFFLYLLYSYGSALENIWGSFEFTVFYGLGALGTMLAGLWLGDMGGAFYLNTTIFLAFAALRPDFELLFFFIIPLKIKWLALVTWIWLGYHFVMSPPQVKAFITVSLLNYVLFFGKFHWNDLVSLVHHFNHKRRFKEWQ